MDTREDAYSNRSSLTAHKRYFGYPANAVLFLFAMSALLGVQLRSLLLFSVIFSFGFFILNLVCRYPANAVLFLFAMSALLGVQLRSLLLFSVIFSFGFFILNLVCRNDPNGIAVWLYVIKKRLLKRITYLCADLVADRPFMFTE